MNGELTIAVIAALISPIYWYLLKLAKSHGEMNAKIYSIEKTLKRIVVIKVR